MLKRFLFLACVFMAAQQSTACPGGQHDECVLPKPWGGCAQRICVPDVSIPNPIDEVNAMISNKAYDIALTIETTDYDDCVLATAAGLAAWGATLGGPVGAGVGAGGGIPVAQIACRRVFDEHEGKDNK